MEKLYFTLKGASPLLMANPILKMKVPSKDTTMKRKVIPTPEEDAEYSRYVTPDGYFYVPAIAVRISMLSGSKGYRIGKSAAKSILSGAVIMVDETFPILRNGEPLIGTDYVIDTRRAVIQHQGIMASRAKIELPWEVSCMFLLNTELASLEHVRTALERAGQVVGILAYRPELTGWFGRFEVGEMKTE